MTKRPPAGAPQANVGNDSVVARDGDDLFGTGAHAGRHTRDLPQVMLLDLRLPRIAGPPAFSEHFLEHFVWS
jgi:hypothetical protein